MKLRLNQFSLRIGLVVLILAAILFSNLLVKSNEPIVVQVCGNDVVVVDGIGMKEASVTETLQQIQRQRKRWMMDTAVMIKVNQNVGYNDIAETSDAVFRSGISKIDFEDGSGYQIIELPQDIEIPTDPVTVPGD